MYPSNYSNSQFLVLFMVVILECKINHKFYFRLELSNLDEIKELMNTEAYNKYLESVAEDH